MFDFKQHDEVRTSFRWLANSQIPPKVYLLKDMSTQHILNVLINVEHIKGPNTEVLNTFKTEIEGRSLGIYSHVHDDLVR